MGLDLGCSFDSISLKLGRTVVPIENWSFWTVTGPMRGGGWRLRKFENFSISNPFVREYGKAYLHSNSNSNSCIEFATSWKPFL